MTQYIRYWGSAASAFLSYKIPSGRQEIMLGRYLCSPSTLDKELNQGLTYIYGKTTSPRFTWLKGHLYDLIGKVLTVVYGYLTLPKIAATFTTLLVAKTTPPRLTMGLCTLGHAVVWSPVIFKLLHMILDYCNLSSKKPEKEVYILGESVQSFLFLAPHFTTVVLLVSAVANPILSRLVNVSPGPAILPFIKSIGYGTLFFGLFTGLDHFGTSSPPYPGEMASVFKTIGKFATGERINSLTALPKLFDSLKILTSQNVLSSDERDRITDRVERLLYDYLRDEVYAPLSEKQFTILEEKESELRSIFGNQGLDEDVYRRFSNKLREQYPFTTMLLCANLHRLKAKEAELTSEQFRLIQYGLYIQAAYDLGPIKDPSFWVKHSDHYQAYCKNQGETENTLKGYTQRAPRFKILHQAFESLPDFQSTNMDPDLHTLLKTLANGVQASQQKILTYTPAESDDNSDAFIASLYPDIPIAQWHTQKRLSFTQIYEAALRN